MSKYDPKVFASASDLLFFIQKNCPINIKIQKCAYNVYIKTNTFKIKFLLKTILLLWNETTITEENRKGSFSYLLQKVGKSLEMRQNA
jgi:hypothetical protein